MRSVSWLTVSNAFCKSKNTPQAYCSELQACLIFSVICISGYAVEWLQECGIWYVLVKYGVKTEKTNILKNFWNFKNKARQTINFQLPTTPANHLFLETKILKIADFIKYRYALFVRSSLRKEGVALFNDTFTTTDHKHKHITGGPINHLFNIPQGETTHFGDYSIRSNASKVWNILYRPSNCNSKFWYHRSFLISTAMILKIQLCSSLFLFFCLRWFGLL